MSDEEYYDWPRWWYNQFYGGNLDLASYPRNGGIKTQCFAKDKAVDIFYILFSV